MTFISGGFISGHRKEIIRVVAVLAAFLIVLIVVVNKVCNYPANVTTVDTSGRYILENVPVGRVWTLGGMAYLRVIDRENPEKAYRTPLYSTQSLDMRLFEDGKSVGVYWLYFNKKEHSFDIAMPEWEWHWLDLFISNTPYTHLEN